MSAYDGIAVSGRLLLLAVTAAVLAGCGDGEMEGGAGAGRTEVSVTVDLDGSGPEGAVSRTVSCDGGTGGRECSFLADVPLDAFDRLAPSTACTQVFGGPQTAQLRGTVRGERVDAGYSRENGCETARWDRVAILLRSR